MDQKINFEEVMAERFRRLPPSVQAAITSADVEAHLRELAKGQQLHLDQWDLLENEVMLTLLGLAKTSELKQNIMKEVGVTEEVAAVLAGDIAEYVFKPIRDELERQLEHPAAQAVQVSDMEAMRSQALSDAAAPTATPTAPVATSTTPVIPTGTKPSSGEKAVQAATSSAYISRAPSHERKTIEGDPYREQIV